MKRLLTFLLAALLLTGALLLPALADSGIPGDSYVLDEADILTDHEEAVLENAAHYITQAYGCGVHIAAVDDMGTYGYGDIESFAEYLFDSRDLGTGPDRDGILLVLSMAERDFDLDAHGEFGNYAFNDYGRTTITKVFLDNFREDDWYGGFYDYLGRCETMLKLARGGEPVESTPLQRIRDRITPGGLGVSGVLSLLLAWFVCSLLAGRNRSVQTAADANRYTAPGSVDIRARSDQFTHQTVTRRKIERSSGSSRSGGGGGHSHTSGKF